MDTHRISAGALVEHDGRLLMVHHLRHGHHDFWVAPGGGVQGDESYENAARREAWEETGLRIDVGRLLYIEDLIGTAGRVVKFWFQGRVTDGSLDVSHAEAQREHIVDAAWLAPAEFTGKAIYPRVLLERYASDRRAGFPEPVRLPLRHMDKG